MLPAVSSSPSDAGFGAIPESAPHDAVWLAWPYLEWGPYLADAQAELVAYAAALADVGGEAVRMLVATKEMRARAEAALGDTPITLVDGPYGDIWTRDTGPTFLRGPEGELGAACFAWNGWGGKYLYDDDRRVGSLLAQSAGAREFDSALIVEGGAVELDGFGSCLTTRHCLLNDNRNPGLSEAEVTDELERMFGASNVLWLDGEGLKNDHTDCHVDTLARFIGRGRVVCMEPAADDPNAAELESVRSALGDMRDARGERFDVTTIPSPGRVERDDGLLMPASYANFFVANRAVFVPTYGVNADEAAVDAIGLLFPGRVAVGIDARAILTGGGALHCITRELPQSRSVPEGGDE
jgi:agmatine deiminase